MDARSQQFDSIMWSLLTRIDTLDDLHSLDFTCNEPASKHEMLEWEKRNMPFRLPNDLKAFYCLFNGFQLNWKINIRDKPVTIGEIALNKVEDINRIPIEGVFLSNETIKEIPYPDRKLSASFILYTSAEYGDIVLLYRNSLKASSSPPAYSSQSVTNTTTGKNLSYENPEIWYRDTTNRWHFIASSFTHFLRLISSNYAICGWQHAFTPEGLSETTKVWMNLCCKIRLCISNYWHNHMVSTAN